MKFLFKNFVALIEKLSSKILLGILLFNLLFKIPSMTLPLLSIASFVVYAIYSKIKSKETT